jgi:hypothetical protein
MGGEQLRRSHPGVGEHRTHRTARSIGYRWFTDPAVRKLYLPEDVVYTAVPGSESYDKLQFLSVIGNQTVRSDL